MPFRPAPIPRRSTGGVRTQPAATYATSSPTPPKLRCPPLLRQLCARKALLEGRDRPLLLKSPPDYAGGIARLADAFPHARFIVIHRHPLPTLQSQVRAWRATILRRNSYLALIDLGYRTLLEDPGRRMSLGMFCIRKKGLAGWRTAS